jgi:hypothetical protein
VEDDYPEDNHAEFLFNITDSVYSRCDDIPDDKYMMGLYHVGEEGEPNEQQFLGSAFPIYGDVEINSVSVYITGGLADGMIEFRSVLFWEPPQEGLEEPYPIQMLVSDMVVLDSSMHNTWVTIPLIKDGESEFLEAGKMYFAGIEYWNYHTENVPYKKYQNFEIGVNRGLKRHDPPNRARYLFQGAFRKFDWALDIWFMFRINLNDHSNRIDGIESETINCLLKQNYPNPASDYTEIEYLLMHSSDVKIEVMDLAGRMVFQIDHGYRNPGSHRIRINTYILEAGTYFYSLKAGQFVDTKRMFVVK